MRFPVFRILILLYCFVFCLFGTNQRAQAQSYTLEYLNNQYEALGKFVFDLSVDGVGNVWVSTENGLFFYNGESFRQVSLPNKSESFYISALAVNADTVYFAGNDGSIYSWFSGQVISVKEPGPGGARVQVLRNFGSGIYGFDQGRGLFKLKQDGSILYAGFPEVEGMIKDILIANNTLFMATTNGVYQARMEGAVRHSTPQLISSEQLLSTLCIQMHPDGSELYIGTEDQGVYCWNMEKDTLTQLGLLTSETVVFMEVFQNELWAGTRNRGIYKVLDIRGNPMIGSKINPVDERKKILGNDLSCAHALSRFDLWIGTNGNGLMQAHLDEFEYIDLFAAHDIRFVNDVIPYGRQWILLGTDKGLYRIDRDEMSIPDRSTKAELMWKESPIRSLYLDQQNQLWMGSDRDGIYRARLDESGDLLSVKKVDPDLRTKIWTISGDDDGEVWVAAMTQGIRVYDADGDMTRKFSMDNGFIHNEIYALEPKADGGMCIGTPTNGLALYDSDGSFSMLTRDDKILLKDVSAIQSLNGGVWVASLGQGIGFMRGDSIWYLHKEEGLLNDYCIGLAGDQAGNLWVVHQDGLSLVDSNRRVFRQVHTEARVTRNGFLRNSVTTDPDGHIWIGGYGGVIRINYPHELSKPTYAALIPEELLIFYKPLGSYTYTDGGSGEFNANRIIRLNYDQNHVTINLSHPTFRFRNQYLYQFKLEGLDQDWTPLQKEQSATYTNLDPGTYTFRARPVFYGQPGEESQVTFIVKPAIWDQLWFQLMCVTLFLIGFFGIYRVRVYSLHRTKIRLQELVSERTEHLKQRNEEIEQFTYSVTHDLKNPVHNIQGAIGSLREFGELKEDDEPLLEVLEDSTNKLHENLERIAEVLRSDYSYLEQKEWLYVEDVMEELHKNMDLLIQESQADIRVHKEFDTIYFNASYFYSFIYNLVSNSIKYRHPERPCVVHVYFEITDDQHVRIRVKDNGLGIDMAKDGDKIFKLFRRIHDHTEGSGVGLHLIKKMIERSRGTITVDSVLGEGTEFIIRLVANHK